MISYLRIYVGERQQITHVEGFLVFRAAMRSNVWQKRLSDSAVFVDVPDFLDFFLDSRTGVVFYKLFYPTAQMITFVFPAEAFGIFFCLQKRGGLWFSKDYGGWIDSLQVFSTQIRVWSMSIIAFCGRMAPLVLRTSDFGWRMEDN